MAIQASGGKGVGAGCCPNQGTYTGDGTQNRAIAHGLGRAPKIVFVFNLSIASIIIQDAVSGTVECEAGPLSQIYAVTVADTTNFYIGFTTGFWGNDGQTSFSFIAI
jgi:hypothetical protein